MIDFSRQELSGFRCVEDYYYDNVHHSKVWDRDDLVLIIDYDLCSKENDDLFSYSKYCEMQNRWMAQSDRLLRFYTTDDEDDTDEVIEWLSKKADSLQIKDTGGSFQKAHFDNTPLEKAFEDLFIETYGRDAAEFLHKEYPISMDNGRNAFVDYVVETATGSYAIEENGVTYHHPQIILRNNYEHQLEKQNTLSVCGFKPIVFHLRISVSVSRQ